VERGFFGWQIEEPSRKEIEAAGLTTMAGAKLDQLLHRGPANLAGLKTGDIVIRAADQPVMNRGDLRFIASLVKPGDQLHVTYQRGGRALTTTITATRSAPQVASTGSFRVAGIGGIEFRKGRAGIEIAVIDDKQAAKTGLAKGMEITEINGKPVTNLAEAEAAVVSGVNQVKTRRGGDEMTLAIRLPVGAPEEK
jgi:S1-C subfamily serine protease